MSKFDPSKYDLTDEGHQMALGIGHTMIVWQMVEAGAANLFHRAMVGAVPEASSVAFHQVEGFSKRLYMLHAAIKQSINPKALKHWNTLHQRIKDATGLRNRIVHYQMTGHPKCFLEPNLWNLAEQLKRKGEKNPARSKMSVAAVWDAQNSIRLVAEDIPKFERWAIESGALPQPLGMQVGAGNPDLLRTGPRL